MNLRLPIAIERAIWTTKTATLITCCRRRREKIESSKTRVRSMKPSRIQSLQLCVVQHANHGSELQACQQQIASGLNQRQCSG